jgi:hypothetical protein
VWRDVLRWISDFRPLAAGDCRQNDGRAWALVTLIMLILAFILALPPPNGTC